MIHLKEKTIKTKTVHKGIFLTLKRDKVLLPNGSNGVREWIEHPGAVCCIPILPDGKIGLISFMIIGINATGPVVQYGYCNDQELFLKFFSQSKETSWASLYL